VAEVAVERAGVDLALRSRDRCNLDFGRWPINRSDLNRINFCVLAYAALNPPSIYWVTDAGRWNACGPVAQPATSGTCARSMKMEFRQKFGIDRILRGKAKRQPFLAAAAVSTADTVVAVRAAPEAVGGRRTQRKSTRSLGYVIDQSGKELECTVRDISSTGAKAMLNAEHRKPFAPAPSLPESFRLVILQDAVEVDAKLAWTRGNTFGIVFQSAFRPTRRSALARM
jgi:hypothetical protein